MCFALHFFQNPVATACHTFHITSQYTYIAVTSGSDNATQLLTDTTRRLCFRAAGRL
jgi:hypothetical protein